jgi:hypothetical protein
MTTPSKAATEAARPWECFQDPSYFDMWCVRQSHERAFGQGYHLLRGEEAEALTAMLNSYRQPIAAKPDTVEAVRNAIGNAIFDTVESDVLACALTTSELAIIAQAAIAAMQPVVTDDAAEQRGREAERAEVVAYHGRYPK